MEHVLNMWKEVATLEHIICPRIRKCLNQTGKSPYVEEHHLHRWDPSEWRHSCVAQVSARCWALTVFKRSVINIQRHFYGNCGFGLSSDQQILHYWSAPDFGLTNTTARWATPQNMCEEPNMCEIWDRTTRIRTDGAEDEPEITVRLMMELGNGFTADPNQDNDTITRAQVFL